MWYVNDAVGLLTFWVLQKLAFVCSVIQFVFFSFGTCAKQLHKKTRIKSKSGFWPMVASYGNIPLFMPSILILLCTYDAVLNASAQYFFALLPSFSIHWTISQKVRLRLSAMPFFRVVRYSKLLDTFSMHTILTFFLFLYSPPLLLGRRFDYDFSLRDISL